MQGDGSLFCYEGSSEYHYGNQLANPVVWQYSDIHGLVLNDIKLKVKTLPYPVILLGVPLGAKGVERLVPLGTIGELEEAGECAPVLSRVEEDGVLEVDAMGNDVIVHVHPVEGIEGKKAEAAAGIVSSERNFEFVTQKMVQVSQAGAGGGRNAFNIVHRWFQNKSKSYCLTS